MKKRWSANTWVLTVLGTILLLIGIDVGRRLVAGPPPEPEPPKVSVEPEFKLGDLAPDFTLPDEKGKKQRLSDLVKRDTVLTFSCGCNQCKEFQTWAGKVLPVMGKSAPDVISVNTTAPEAAEAWERDTRLHQTFLYGPHNKGEVAVYKGHPCPRAFRLGADRKVRWIGGSRAEGRTVEALGTELAAQLNVEKYGTLPRMDWVSEGAMIPMQGMPPGAAPPGAVPPPGHSADDGHGH